MRYSRLTWAALALLGVTFAASVAMAQGTDKDQLARQHFLAGSAYFEAGRYQEAAQQFEEAYALSQRSALLSNIFRAYERLGDLAKAEEALSRYVAADPDASDREVLELRLENMHKRRRETVPDAPAEEPPGDADAEGHVPAPEGQAAAQEQAGASAAPSSPGMVYTGFGLMGLGGASAVVALVTGLRANGMHGDLGTACPDGVCDPSLQSTADKGQRLAVLSTVFTGLAIASAGVGLVLWLLGRGGREDTAPADSVRLEWTSGPGLAGLGARVRY